jgi:hypothetical protein
MDRVLDEDAEKQKAWGFHDKTAHAAMRQHLVDLLDDYVGDTERLVGLTALEAELNVPIPSRSGRRMSSRYRFQSFIDGWWVDEYGQAWVVEFKLRGELWPAWLIQLSRQMRWYTWSWSHHSGIVPVGVMVDARLNELPKPPRLVQPKSKADRAFANEDGLVPSHAKDQLCRVDDYLCLCGEHGVEPSPEAVDNMRQRRWQQRVPILFRDSELEEAGKELVTAAKVIRDLDSGELYPLRNAHPRNCKGCRYRDICPAPDAGLVEQFFERTEPKRSRTSDPVAA